ncbi:MAG: hypothetical protein ACYCT1_20045 [Steroidobacteraceae bacterium]
MRPQSSEVITIAKFVGKWKLVFDLKGDLLNLFKTKVRPLLNPTARNKGLWVNKNGDCLGKLNLLNFIFLEGDNFNNRVQKCLNNIFPEKHLTPMDFRRIIPSLIFEHNDANDNKSLKEVFQDYFLLINTSIIYLFSTGRCWKDTIFEVKPLKKQAKYKMQ